MSKKPMTKKEVMQEFKEFMIPAIIEQYGTKDKTAVQAEWQWHVDSLQKNGQITEKQATTWVNPF